LSRHAGLFDGKPANEYTISDPRVVRVVERNLKLSAYAIVAE
jgi:hypothetical protein